MDEKTAWEIFCKTGKVKDYITYTQIKSNMQATGIINQVNASSTQTLREFENKERHSYKNDSKNQGTYN